MHASSAGSIDLAREPFGISLARPSSFSGARGVFHVPYSDTDLTMRAPSAAGRFRVRNRVRMETLQPSLLAGTITRRSCSTGPVESTGAPARRI